jgi:AraC-like DNA-binding protein
MTLSDSRARAVIYLELQPAAQLAPFIRAFWYAYAPVVEHSRERILPSGCLEVILNLASDHLMDCSEGGPDQPNAPALIVGARSVYEIVDTADMASLIGVQFRPGGFSAFAADRADQITNQTLPLEDLWGASVHDLRDTLRELASPRARFNFLQEFFLLRLKSQHRLHSVVDYALRQLAVDRRSSSVREIAASTGLSERRFSQIFREQVGFSPKGWHRLQRFQRAVKQLHAGVDMPWAELALECGFYDQSHFANEFRAFSGIDATTYTANRTRFTNHIAIQ